MVFNKNNKYKLRIKILNVVKKQLKIMNMHAAFIITIIR